MKVSPKASQQTYTNKMARNPDAVRKEIELAQV